MVGVRFFRLIYFLPVISSIAVVSLLWRWIRNTYFGLMNIFLRALVLIDPPLWLGNAEWAKPALIIMEVWGDQLQYDAFSRSTARGSCASV